MTAYTYDAADNRTSIKDPLNNLTQFTYNTARQALTFADARNKATTNTYDAAGSNLLTTTDPLNHTTTYSYSLITGLRTPAKRCVEQPDHLRLRRAITTSIHSVGSTLTAARRGHSALETPWPW